MKFEVTAKKVLLRFTTFAIIQGKNWVHSSRFAPFANRYSDRNAAIAGGMTDIFRDADNVWCTQHSQERDALKPKSLRANERSRNRIMTDIYGSQDDVLLQNSLADADDSEDFQIKLASLETVWESLVPGFHKA